MPEFEDDHERFARQLEVLQQQRFRDYQGNLNDFWDDEELRIHAMIETERSASQTYSPDPSR